MNEKSESVLNIYRDIIFCHYHLQAYGKKLGAITPKGLAVWNLLTSIQQDERITIAKLAQQRSVARQFIQKKVKELLADNLVAFIDNPKHKKSKCITLSQVGLQLLGDMHQKLLRETAKLVDGLDVNVKNLASDLKLIKKLLVEQI